MPVGYRVITVADSEGDPVDIHNRSFDQQMLISKLARTLYRLNLFDDSRMYTYGWGY